MDQSLQNCTYINNLKLLDDEVFITLNIIGVLGIGNYSIVYKLLLDDNVYALRISTASHRHFEGELNISCMINDLRVYTNSLQSVRYFAYFNNNIKSMLYYYLKRYGDGHIHGVLEHGGEYFALVTDIIQDIGYPILNSNEKVDFVFELLMAVYILNSHNIAHGDLHVGNVGYTLTDIKRSYRINGKNYLVTSKYMPILFDYGNSYYINDGREIYSVLEDHTQIVEILNHKELDIILYAKNVKEFGKIFSGKIFKNIRHRKIESSGEYVTFFKEIYV
tara:strand:+ start:1786 stop:2616 length:831 start_codon:yes stop_codon:yes gene_type:complete